MTTTTTTAATAPATTYEEALEDVHTRFILNLPPSELQTADRIFFQLEQAWWFYEDWICDPHPEWNLPRFATFKPFAAKLFEYSPLLHSGGDDSTSQSFAAMWNAFSNYKRKISNYGCILLNAACTHAVLCRVWNGKSYTFPAGKINQNEDGKAAAARETYEETGFDPLCKFGITASWKQQQQQQQQQSTTTTKMITWKDTISEQDALVFTEENGKRRTAYVVVGVPEDFPFEPVARKEVSSVAFFPLDDLPKSSYGVIPFLGPLRRWIRKYCKANGIPVPTTTTAAVQQQQQRKTPNRSRGRSSRGRNNNSQGRQGSTGRGRRLLNEQDDLVATGLLASAGQEAGWSEEEMFRVNEALLGRRVEYDGNPHVFTDQGCGGDGGDPHAFRVVGGTFLNAAAGDNGTTTNNNNNNNNSAGQTTTLLAPPPDRSKMQPLFRQGSNESNNNNNDDDNDNNKKKKSTGPELTPFFSHDGATPWGDVVEEARGVDNFKSPGRSASRTKKQQRSKKKKKKQQQQQQQQPSKSGDAAVSDEDDEADDAVFMTDAQITAKSQKSKTSIQSYTQYRQQLEREYQQDLAHIQQWVANLPKPKPTKRFGEFKLDVDRIMAAVTPILQLTPDEL